MNVPGSNLLGIALGLIGSQSVTYLKNTGRTTSATGRYVAQFAAPVTVAKGSVQAVPRDKFENLGLDYQKNYVQWYAMRDPQDVNRDYSGDEILYAGRKYQLVSGTHWFAQDGWTGVIAIDIGPAS